MKKIALITALLLIFIFYKAVFQSRTEASRELAEKLLNSADIKQVKLSSTDEPPAFQIDSRAALFFERKGMQGLIRGVMVIEDDQVVDLQILQSNEGLDHNALDSGLFCTSFRDKPAKPPLVVDSISGATISSQAVTDAVNTRLAQWVKHTQGHVDGNAQQ